MTRLPYPAASLSVHAILFTLSVLLGAGAARAQVNLCGQYDTVSVAGRYNVQNNYWHQDACPGNQCVNVNTGNGDYTVTGSFNCPNGGVASFPSIYYGCHYGNCSPGTSLPLPVSKLQCVTSSWSFTPTNTGSWNGAYDLLFSSNGGSTPGAELMVWLDYPNTYPAGSTVATVDFNGASYTLWFGQTFQTYIAYVANTPTTSVSNLNLMDFINDSVSRGYFPNSWYLLSIEAGIETRSEGLPFASKGFTAWVNNNQCGGDPSTPTATPLPATPTPTPPPTASTWRIHCGGNQYVDSLGQTWMADTHFNGGFTAQTNNAILGTSDPVLYDDERAGTPPFTYTFNVPTGSYQVTLKFAEVFWSSAGQRVFNALINGNQVLTNFDIVADAGGVNRADDKVFNNITPDANGQITVQLGPASVDEAKISAIQVIPQPLTTPTPTPTPPPTVFRVHCGGPQYVDSLGQTWVADTAFNGGYAYQTNNSIAGTSDPALYDDERAGNPAFTYTFSVPAGSYQVTLKFAEVFWSSVGQRVFNALINGNQVLTNFDIVADAGGANRADDKVFNNITPDANGQITVQLGPSSVDNAKVSAIQVITQASAVRGPAVAAAPPGLKEATPTPTATPAAAGRDLTVAAVPNISHGEPVRFFIDLPQPSPITLSLFSLTGEKVYEATLEGSAGSNNLVWPLQNQARQAVASGLYLYRLEAQTSRGAEMKTGKVAVIH